MFNSEFCIDIAVHISNKLYLSNKRIDTYCTDSE